MNFNKQWLKGFFAGVAAAAVLSAGVVFAAGNMTTVTAYVDGMLHMSFNGEEYLPAESDGSATPVFLYNNRTYLPLRAISEKAGVYVDYDDKTSEVILKSENELLNRAVLALHCLKYGDYDQLSSMAHKNKGVAFAPYAYFESDAVVFTAEELETLNPEMKFTWGAYDGTGDPMNLSVENFFANFVYDKNYIKAPLIGINEIIRRGNSLINIGEAFPGAEFVEFSYPPSERDDSGNDLSINWSSLRLIFEKQDGVWMLAGVAHDGWST